MASYNYSWIQALELVVKGHILVIQNVDKFVLAAAHWLLQFFVLNLTNLNAELCIRKGYIWALFLFSFLLLIFSHYKIIL